MRKKFRSALLGPSSEPLVLQSGNFRFRKKSCGVKSGEYGGQSMVLVALLVLSSCKIPELFIGFSRISSRKQSSFWCLGSLQVFSLVISSPTLVIVDLFALFANYVHSIVIILNIFWYIISWHYQPFSTCGMFWTSLLEKATEKVTESIGVSQTIISYVLGLAHRLGTVKWPQQEWDLLKMVTTGDETLVYGYIMENIALWFQ